MAVIRGKAYWAKILGDPAEGYDPGEREWSIDVTVDEEARNMLQELGVADKINSPTHNKRGEERPKPHDSGSEFITFKRKEFKKDGEAAKPIRVVDSKKQPWPQDALIGNGSEVIVQFVVNEGEYRGKPWKKPGIVAVMVKDLVPYEADELDEFADSDNDFDDDLPFDNE